MKLFVLNKSSNSKLFLRAVAPNRGALARKFGGLAFRAEGATYHVNEVQAEKGSDNTTIGMLVGGVIGALGGGPGVAAGGLIGAILGKEQDKKEESEVTEFNRSQA